YTATYIGDFNKILFLSDSLVNRETGLSYAFVNTTRPLTDAERVNLPTETLAVGWTYPVSQQFTMRADAINSSGTVIGGFPQDTRDPGAVWDYRTEGYAIRSADGHYNTGFVMLSPGGDYSHPWTSSLYLSQSNKILIQDPHGARLFDVNTGTMTPIVQL